MSKPALKMLKKYFQLRKDAGEDGFWADKRNTKAQAPKTVSKSNCKSEKLDKIKKDVLKCNKCPLGACRLNPCFGKGNPDSRLMFVGEGPGYEEDHTGIVFVGRAGKLLDRIIKEAFNLKSHMVYIANIVKCHPMRDPANPQKRGNDRPPAPQEIKQCIPYLVEQVNLIRPEVIITLGSPATKTILNTDRGITGLRGKVFDVRWGEIDVKVVPTYHPAYLLRKPSEKEAFFEDMKIIRSLL